MTRQLLAPGLRAVPRGRTGVQVGLDRAVVLERTPANTAELDALLDGRPFDLPALAAVSIAADDWSGGTATAGVAARAAAHPEGWTQDPTRVAVLGDLIQDTGLLSGLTPTSPADADVVVHAWAGEVDRARLDPLMRDGRPHLLLRYVDATVTVGPFVVPGRSACLRCIDAHHASADPLYPLLADRYAHATRSARPDGVPDPLEPALVQLGWALAVRDLTAWAHGDVPSTYSRTLRVGPRAEAPRLADWRRHPRCACAWATMDE